MRKKLSSNFWLSEFKNFPENPTKIEEYLLNNLVSNLQVVRTDIEQSMDITDCYRDDKRFLELIKKGYNPSPTSDHFWNQPIELLERQYPKQFKKYGESYNFSVGASDVVTENARKVFEDIVSDKKYSKMFGQVIFEKNGLTEWIHFSNPITILYSEKIVEELDLYRDQFLMSLDGGKSYRKVA
jgi:hypothetical protein